jgi:K+-sensing histidine kinase KdpD
LECVPYPADLLAEDLRDRLQMERAELAKRVEWFFCGQRAVALVDATLVLEALTELLENAAGFSPLESPLQLTVAQVENGVRWCIEQDSIEPPNQSDQWGMRPLVSTRRGHYGLGLFRVRRILQAHKASLVYRYNVGRKRLATEVVFSGNTV